MYTRRRVATTGATASLSWDCRSIFVAKFVSSMRRLRISAQSSFPTHGKRWI
jgi:hypothetical protein